MPVGLVIERVVNSPIPSNCYIVYKTGSEVCLVIDPSNESEMLLEQKIRSKNLKPHYIILTHEHFDHIGSVGYLKQIFNCKVVATAKTSDYIGNSRKNCSFYYDGIGFTCAPADILVENSNEVLIWNDIAIEFYLTPGHSEGSSCFKIGPYFFTGDTLMLGYDTVVKLPGGNKEALKKSLEKILPLIDDNTIICPGHGKEFVRSEMPRLKYL